MTTGSTISLSQDPVWARCESPEERRRRYREAATAKKKDALDSLDDANPHGYYGRLVAQGQARESSASKDAVKQKKQIDKDLPRTLGCLTQAAPELEADDARLAPLRQVLLAYMERARILDPVTQVLGLSGTYGRGGVTTPRRMLATFPQGLNFFAYLCLIAAAGGDEVELVDLRSEDEEVAFWLLALFMEEVLDPDFYGEGQDRPQMGNVGGMALRDLIVDEAPRHWPDLHDALGAEAFPHSLHAALNPWVLSVFLGLAPKRLLLQLWERLLLRSGAVEQLAAPASDRGPCGLAVLYAFSLAVLSCCGQAEASHADEVRRLREFREAGASPEDLNMESAELMRRVKRLLEQWPASGDQCLWATTEAVAREALSQGAEQLWTDLRQRKQQLVDCAAIPPDMRIEELCTRTHFSKAELLSLFQELDQLRPQGEAPHSWCTCATFRDVVARSTLEFPSELCEQLFSKLDTFGNGRLASTELVCGLSVLALGSVDEKLQLCFDLFDSGNRRALRVKDVSELCAMLFKVALDQGSAMHSSVGSLPGSFSEQVQGFLGSDSSGEALLPPAASWHSGQRQRPPPPPGDPWRSMFRRLLAAAQRDASDHLVSFEDFRAAALMEPALLNLFTWCLPVPPETASTISLNPRDFSISGGSEGPPSAWRYSRCFCWMRPD